MRFKANLLRSPFLKPNLTKSCEFSNGLRWNSLTSSVFKRGTAGSLGKVIGHRSEAVNFWGYCFDLLELVGKSSGNQEFAIQHGLLTVELPIKDGYFP